MKHTNQSAFIGDLVIFRVNELPSNVSTFKSVEHFEVAPSHILKGRVDVYETTDVSMRHVILSDTQMIMTHARSNHPHESVTFTAEKGAIFRIVRQRERGPEGYQLVQD